MADASKHEVPPSATAGKKVADTLEDKAKEVMAGAADAARTATDKVKELALAASEKAKDVAAATGEVTVHAKDKVHQWTATATDKTGEAVQDMGKELTGLVRRYSIPSLLLGFAVGFLLARATTRS